MSADHGQVVIFIGAVRTFVIHDITGALCVLIIVYKRTVMRRTTGGRIIITTDTVTAAVIDPSAVSATRRAVLIML